MKIYEVTEDQSYGFSPTSFLNSRQNRGDNGVAERFNRRRSSDQFETYRSHYGRSVLSEMIVAEHESDQRIWDQLDRAGYFEELDHYRSPYVRLSRVEDFVDIPDSMKLPILWYRPVREAVQLGRMEGFDGLDASAMTGEDPYERLIHNGRADVGDDGRYELNWRFEGDDPEMSFDEISIVEEVRRVIREDLIPNGIDPTNSNNEID